MNGVSHYDIPISAFMQQLHASLPATYLWGYGGTFPSRTIEAVVGSPIEVRWINNLLPTDAHPLAAAIDRTNVGGMTDPNGVPLARPAHHDAPARRAVCRGRATAGRRPGIPAPSSSPSAPYGAGNEVLFDGFNNGDTYYLPEHPAGHDAVVPRPRDGDHALQRVSPGLAGFWLLREPARSRR